MPHILGKKQDPIQQCILNRVLVRNKNWIEMTTGATGSGKSYSALKRAEDLMNAQRKKFTINYCVFSPQQFMNILNNEEIKEHSKGQVIIWEEIGIGMSSRNWQSTVNKSINYVMQSMRSMNLIVLMNAPAFSYLDVGTRRLMHAIFETNGINTREKTVRLKPLWVQPYQRSNKIYFHYPKLPGGMYGTEKIKEYMVGMPSEELKQAYESKKKNFLIELNEKIKNDLEKLDAPRKVLFTPFQTEIMDLINNGKTKQEIMNITGMTSTAVDMSLLGLRKKGVAINIKRSPETIATYEIQQIS